MLGVAAFVLFGVVSCLDNLLGSDSPNSGPGSGSDPSTPTPDMEVAWLSSAHDLDPGLLADAEMRLGVDGSFTGVNFVPGQDVWIVVLSPSAGKSEQVVGVDPTDGHARWNRELPGVLCGDKVLDGALVCLSGEAGSWTGHVIDVATGEDLTTWPTTLDSALSVHLTPERLVVVGEAAPAPHARLTLLALDGTVRWSLDIGELQNAELLFGTFLADDFSGQNDPEATMERLRWRDLDEGRVLLWSTPGVALIDPTTGDVVVHECRRATPVGEAYFCGTDAGIERHDLTGAVAWTTPGLDLAFPPDTSNGRPAALSADHQLYAVDWRTGVQGQNLHRFRPTANSFTGTVLAPGAAGDDDHLFVVGDDAVVALAPGSDEVAWTYVLDEYANAVAVVGDMAVLDSWPAIGLDLATGEELWRRSIGPGIYQVAVDDSLVSIGFDGIALLVLP